ncbi:hypothetical protein MOQ_007463, partial [Trypanosoma cruzi marinkellei]
SPNDTAGAPREAEKKSDLPCNDDVAADGVTSVVGQPAGDEAASDRAGDGATTAGPRGPDAADAAQCAVDPPRSDADAAVGRGDREADMTDAPPPIHGNNAGAAVPVRRRGTTVLGAAWIPLRGEATAVASCVARTQPWLPNGNNPCQLVPLHICMLRVPAVRLCVWYWGHVRCTVLSLCCLLMQRHHTVLFHCFSFCLIF